jgi:hypothetical protein
VNKAQAAIVRRFRRLVKDAAAADLVLAVDASAWGLRFIPRDVERTADDLCEVGEVVSVDSTCGTPVPGSLSGRV